MTNVTRATFSCYFGAQSIPNALGSEVRLTHNFPNMNDLLPEGHDFRVVFNLSEPDPNVTTSDLIQTLVDGRSDLDFWDFGMSAERYKSVDYLMFLEVRIKSFNIVDFFPVV